LAHGVVLHADVDAFFASVEQRDDPSLRGQPVIVGGGVVMAASYEARRFGVRSGMAGSRARRLCPQAIVVPSRFAAYAEASRAVFAVFARTAPVVEAMSIEEAFLEIGVLARTTAPAIARRGLTCIGLTVTNLVDLDGGTQLTLSTAAGARSSIGPAAPMGTTCRSPPAASPPPSSSPPPR
jgi:nucleotidyltransferase/DNA polymerase involved in DNA repair